METIKIMFAGGGTGGHFYPALAIADRITEIGTEQGLKMEIVFAGTKRGIEYRMRESYDYPLFVVNVRGLKRSLSFSNLAVPFLAVWSLIRSYNYLSKFKPHAVVGTGGYVSWPLLQSASMLSIDIALQEQNSYPGLVTRKIAPKAKKIFLGFKKAEEYLRTSAEILATGNPVRKNLCDGNREKTLQEYGLDTNKKTILILGGSQGASSINNAILKSIENRSIEENYQILWQTGKRDYTEVSAKAGKKALCSLFPFAKNMSDIYSAADLVIARAGASTLAELGECTLPSLLIPFPYATEDHQMKNALSFTEQGWADVVDEKELEETDVIKKVIDMDQDGRADKMREKMQLEKRQNEPAVDRICLEILKMIDDTRKKKTNCAS